MILQQPRIRWLLSAFSIAFLGPSSSAQVNWLTQYQNRAVATQGNQPHWASPLVTTNPRIEQGFRADFVRQTSTIGESTWDLGDTKGLQVIPFPRVELRISPPPFISHSNGSVLDGFGDVAFRLKYRLYGSNESHHNGIFTALIQPASPPARTRTEAAAPSSLPALSLVRASGNLL